MANDELTPKQLETLNDKVFAILATGSTDQLVALGRLSLAFGAIDEAVTKLILAVLPIENEKRQDTALNWIASWEFKRKLKFMRKMIIGQASKCERSPNELFGLLDTLIRLANHRHDLVHGWITWDREKNRPVFENKAKGKLRSADPNDIRQLIEELWKCLDQIVAAFVVFMGA